MSAWHDTRVLVTGATGFIGGHLVRRLSTLGAQVHAVSRRPPTPSWTHRFWTHPSRTEPFWTRRFLVRTGVAR